MGVIDLWNDSDDDENEFAWTTGGIDELSHHRLIATGGTGEVHEVSHSHCDSLIYSYLTAGLTRFCICGSSLIDR